MFRITFSYFKFFKNDREWETSNGKIKGTIAKSWYKFSDYLINKVLSFFKNYNNTITTSLNCYIRVCLLGKENIIYDKYYDKNHQYYHYWTYNIKNTDFINY